MAIYTVSWRFGTVTVHSEADDVGIELDESDLIQMLSDLQAGDAPLSEQAGS